MRGLSIKCFQYCLQHSFKVIPDNIVPEAEHTNPFLLQPLVPLLIGLFLLIFRVASTIQLNYKSLLRTVEIYNISPYRMLATKFKAFQTSVTELSPETGLSLRLVLSEFSSKILHLASITLAGSLTHPPIEIGGHPLPGGRGGTW